MSTSILASIGLLLCLVVSSVHGQGFGYPSSSCPQCDSHHSKPQADRDFMDVSQYRLLEFRRMFKNGSTPRKEDLVGCWRGANKGIVQLAGYRQFIKEIVPDGYTITGDNIQVGQVNRKMLHSMGWQPKINAQTGLPERNGKFSIEQPDGRGAFGNGMVFSYSDGGNTPLNPVNLLVDKVVMIDSNHLLGRVTAKFGPIEIPLAYFVLERM